MSKQTDFEKLLDSKTKVYQVYQVLRDRKWHCRECEYGHTGITQIAGGSGIQGLQRGNKSRPGMQIESTNRNCQRCERTTRHDRWQGKFLTAIYARSMSPRFARRVVDLLGSRDIVEGTERPLNQLTIDHKLPMVRWNQKTQETQTKYAEMSDDDIRATFQLLKKSNGSVSHNLLKSRACEVCLETGVRGAPFGISFFYAGTDKWEPEDKRDPKGCEGCGWYDFDLWRTRLNEMLKQRISNNSVRQ